MAPRLGQRKPFFRVGVGETHDQVEEIFVGFDAPVLHGFDRVSVQSAVIGVVGGGKGKLGEFQDEKNCSAGKDINCWSIVRIFAALKFWCHVVRRATSCLQLDAHRTSESFLEAKIGDLDSAVLVKETIFQFQVTMRDILLVNIAEAVNDLGKDLTGIFVLKTSSQLDIIE